VNLLSDLLSTNNHNGTVLPGVDFNQSQTYVDLSSPLKARPSITVINDPNFQWRKFREMNKTLTTWNIYNSTSGSNGTITFTDCVLTNATNYPTQCLNNPPTFYRQLHGSIYKGIWSLLYPIEKTSDEVLELCPYKDSCINLVVQKSNSTSLELLDSHNDKLYLTGPTTPQGTTKTVSVIINQEGKDQFGQITGNVTEMYSQSVKQDLRGNYNNALALYHRVLILDHYNTYALNGIARVLYELGNYTGSIRYSDKILYGDPYNLVALDGKGLSLYKLGDYLAALKSYDKAFDIDPEFQGLLTNIGLVFYKIKDYQDSLSAFDGALTVNSTDTHALYDRALTFVKLGDIKSALKDLDTVLRINPSDTYALNLKASLISR
jgi:tetratricopeptide (TPR) repeat protein